MSINIKKTLVQLLIIGDQGAFRNAMYHPIKKIRGKKNQEKNTG
ncbi:MAG: hypothetical protein CM1200mP28_16050 [Deltaproteobacteria bacterium]|nr:MAG: hypothetical protein CM1200mP28_16050 [Deltaproteobacteria bacterium]